MVVRGGGETGMTDDRDYFERRAETEIKLAQRATHARAVSAHYQMASAYLDRIHGDTPRPAPNFLDS
jgi:hypothetical protein